MPGPKDEYGKGYADGQNHAEYEKSHSGWIDITLDSIFGSDPRQSNPEAYKGGFEQGAKDGHSEK